MAGVHRAGTVALLGRPNAGKSTLLNALLGEKLVITSPKAQTTRSRILGVLTRPEGQLVLYDTPGVHRGEKRFNHAMTEAALFAARGADLRAILVDARAGFGEAEARLAALPPPLLLVHTKRDLAAPTPPPDPDRFEGAVAVSAKTGEGVAALVEALLSLLPAGPALYPEDYLTSAPLRFLVAEQIREVIFERMHDELPYATAVEVRTWDESDDALRLRADVLVEKESQKGMLVGRGGRNLRAIGSEARHRLAKLVGKPVHLNLFVKTDKNWTKRPRRARELGYL